MKWRGWLAVVAGALMAGLLLGGCAEECELASFAASRGEDGGGAATPLAAAVAAAGVGYGVEIPADGWVQEPGGTPSATWLRSGSARVKAVRLGDGTWWVDEGSGCAA